MERADPTDRPFFLRKIKGGSMASAFGKGLLTGMMLQLAVGPVFFFVMNISMRRGVCAGAAASAAVMTADFIYIILAVAGAGVLLSGGRIRRAAGLFGGIVLAAFGVWMIVSSLSAGAHSQASADSSVQSNAAAAFVLTISSPLTIVFWMGVFASKAAECGYSGRDIFAFGSGAGMSTFLFMGTSAVFFSLFGDIVPRVWTAVLNIAVAALLIVYGCIRIHAAIVRTLPQAG